MSDVLPDEVRLTAEIDRLKAEFPKTRELYREVCALLFFRFGITPNEPSLPAGQAREHEYAHPGARRVLDRTA